MAAAPSTVTLAPFAARPATSTLSSSTTARAPGASTRSGATATRALTLPLSGARPFVAIVYGTSAETTRDSSAGPSVAAVSSTAYAPAPFASSATGLPSTVTSSPGCASTRIVMLGCGAAIVVTSALTRYATGTTSRTVSSRPMPGRSTIRSSVLSPTCSGVKRGRSASPPEKTAFVEPSETTVPSLQLLASHDR